MIDTITYTSIVRFQLHLPVELAKVVGKLVNLQKVMVVQSFYDPSNTTCSNHHTSRRYFHLIYVAPRHFELLSLSVNAIHHFDFPKTVFDIRIRSSNLFSNPHPKNRTNDIDTATAVVS